VTGPTYAKRDWSNDTRDSELGEISAFAFPSNNRLRLVVLIALLDESGTHEGSPIMTLAGFVSTADLWSEFRVKWGNALAAYGLTSFHMSEFTAHVGPFRDEEHWTHERRLALIDRLTTIILETTMFGVSHSLLPPDAYQRVIAPRLLAPSLDASRNMPTLDAYKQPYVWCLHHCLQMISLAKAHLATLPALARHNLGAEKVLCVLDRGAKMAQYVVPAFDHWTREEWGIDLLGPLFESVNNPSFSGLQAADILAFETFRNLRGQRLTPPPPQRKLLTRLIDGGGRLVGGWNDEAALVAFIESIAAAKK
jgi:hypothetical protein